VSGSIISLLRELLGDVYADVRLTALHQVLPVGECKGVRPGWMAGVQPCSLPWLTRCAQHTPRTAARRLRGSGMLFQSDIEALWDLVQPLLLDADVEVSA
jgi:hypothetical protein